MQTKTFTLLVTITDDGIAAAFNPDILAAAVQGALETGIRSFQIDSTAAARLGIKAGEHFVPPVASAIVSAFTGDRVECKPGTVGATAQNGVGATKRLHAAMRAS